MSGIVGGAGANSGSVGIRTLTGLPAFWVTMSSGQNNISNGYTTVPFNNITFQNGDGFNTSNNTFTAPVSAVYHFEFHVKFEEVPPDISYLNTYITMALAPNIHSDPLAQISTEHFDATTAYFALFHVSVTAEMVKGDTAKCRVYKADGTASVDITNAGTLFCGHLVR